MRNLYFMFLLCCFGITAPAQVVINEGSNRNYLQFPDENGEYPDWIELYNKGNQPVNLYNYSLTDNPSNPDKWVFPNISLAAHEYKTVFCSGKDRKPASPFVHVKTDYNYSPQVGWNNHQFTTSFYWDGVSNILINTCSYSGTGYTSNSVFKQSATSYYSTSYNFMDGSDAGCSLEFGTRVKQRPNIKLNGYTIGSGQIQNSPTDYPAPYGNWYWSARHQILIRASELTAAGMSAGNINSLSFNVVSSDPNTVYTYFDIYMRLVTINEISGEFMAIDLNNYLHTNFKISQHGESVYLYSPTQNMVSDMFVHCIGLDNSKGLSPDGSWNSYLFATGTPGESNNGQQTFTEYLLAPQFSLPSGIYNQPVTVTITNPNQGGSSVRYTTDGSDPTFSSPLYTGPLTILYPTVLKARAFSFSKLPSLNTTASYLFYVSHSTPVISVVTDPVNLYGETGIFDNWWTDWERAAYVDYFDVSGKLMFSQRAGIQMDGGWGGSRFQPQHSFRLEPGDGVLGDSAVQYPLIPQKPERLKYSKIYLRNGSNQYLILPYKEGCQAEIASSRTHSYYSAMTPVSVYINGYYFGLYELREKLDEEFFQVYDSADVDDIDLLTLSAWYGSVLRAQAGSVDNFIESYSAFRDLNTSDTGYWNQASQYFDLTWYTDYIIAESWMANTDWPGNNIKIYRKDPDSAWKFIPIDFELGLAPNSWTDCYFDHIAYMLGHDESNFYINIWLKSLQNQRFKNYFINRFADVMNTAYLYDTVNQTENRFFTEFAAEMPREYARWGDQNNIPGQMNTFVENHNTLNSQLQCRSEQVRNHIQSNFDLPNQLDVTLNVYPEEGGKIRISTVTPESYPWQGIYFNGVPVTIEAIPAPGYSFLNWENNGRIPDTTLAQWTGSLGSADINFTAHFDPTSIPVIEEPLPGISIYPNPADKTLYIKNSGKTIITEYRIINPDGRVLKHSSINNADAESAIDITFLKKGAYYLQLFNDEADVKNYRFIKI